ncbi:expressed unknown protein (Partial), partial [Seminavis robusta]|eukprot:Sro556_g165850.1 n/a (169) ;mRNA; r:116-622
MSSFFRSAFRKASPTVAQLMRPNPAPYAMWAFPLALGATWFIWPALDQEWLIELGLAKEPDLHIKAVQAAKDARMAAKSKDKPAAAKEEEEEEEEEEAEEEEAAPAAEEEEEESGGGDEEEAGGEEESGGDDDDEEEGEESALPKFAPLLAKSDGSSLEEAWDNFTLKA